ncbi:MAG: protein-L-isoaspartate(D-aspartate) O-methyltransferase [Chloroflexi bacterium]|nr:protein-L-isoaspartate(D-aspartate) O-methyltransferase [Chloroflexota bacterium]
MNEDEFQIARKRMVEEQIAARGVLNPRLLAVMESVPRHLFVPADDLPWAYGDGPMPIGHGQTISQPYIVALMTELLQVESTDRVLEVGTGSGYQAAVLGQMAVEVHTVEMIPELAAQAARTLTDLGYANVHVHAGDGSLGWSETAPYDGILVAAAAPSAPQPLLDQLAEGGRLVIPVGSRGFQQLEVWKRTGQEFKRQVNLAVAFVPLRGEYGWK